MKYLCIINQHNETEFINLKQVVGFKLDFGFSDISLEYYPINEKEDGPLFLTLFKKKDMSDEKIKLAINAINLRLVEILNSELKVQTLNINKILEGLKEKAE